MGCRGACGVGRGPNEQQDKDYRDKQRHRGPRVKRRVSGEDAGGFPAESSSEELFNNMIKNNVCSTVQPISCLAFWAQPMKLIGAVKETIYVEKGNVWSMADCFIRMTFF